MERLRVFVSNRRRAFIFVWVVLIFFTLATIAYSFLAGPLVLLILAAPLAFGAAVLHVLLYGNTDSNIDPSSSILREGPRAWSVLPWWMIGCAVGGFVGGLGYVAQFLGDRILFGGLLGTAQWLILQRYFRWAGLWVVASFFGWIVGQVATIFVEGAFPSVVDAVFEATGSEILGYAVFDPLVWAVFGLVQGLVFLLLFGLREILLLGLWVLASSSGGIIRAAAIYFEANFLLDGIVSVAVYQSIICALYGIPTGLVLVGLMRRASTNSAGR